MKQLIGGILLSIGVLIAGGSGFCSLAILFSSGEMAGLGMLPAVLVIGGVPFALGVSLILYGRSLVRSKPPGPDLE